MIELERTKTLLSDFGLTSAQDLLESQLERSIQEEDTYLGFLSSLLELEASQRRIRSIETRMKLAKFPYKKTLSDFDFSFQPGLDKRQIDELSELSFAARAENVIFLGPPGVGKTHLAVGLGMAAIDAGMSVYFTTLSELVRDLERAQEAGKLERRWRVYLRPKILIVDEVGYMNLDQNQAELFFRLVSQRYEHHSMIITSNKHFSDWGEMLSDPIIATALLDRLLHHSHIVNINGNTYRLRDRVKAGINIVPRSPILQPD